MRIWIAPKTPATTMHVGKSTGWAADVFYQVRSKKWSWSQFTTDGQSVSLSWCRAPIWSPWPDFCFLSDDCGFLDVWRPLWREDGSVIYLYNCFWSLPEQSLLGRSPAELTTIFYHLIWDSPNLEGQVPVFISPRNRVAQLYPQALECYICIYIFRSRKPRIRSCGSVALTMRH
jgi:hypothetical protein